MSDLYNVRLTPFLSRAFGEEDLECFWGGFHFLNKQLVRSLYEGCRFARICVRFLWLPLAGFNFIDFSVAIGGGFSSFVVKWIGSARSACGFR